jgi:hypothetical protein
MEGFGLFDFLKTLLPTPENGHTQQTGFSDGNGEAQQKTTPPASAEPTQAANTAAKDAIVNLCKRTTRVREKTSKINLKHLNRLKPIFRLA